MVAVADGRRLRREQNRSAVLDAMAALFAEGVLQPGADEIAARAGVSSRSLFRYFDDVEDLSRAAIDRQLEAARPLLDVAAHSGDPIATKIERLVAARVRLFETTAPAARAARAFALRHRVVADQVRRSRSFLRHQVRTLFGPELADRPHLLPAVDALCSFETYELLRRDQGLSRARTAAALAAALTELLDR